MLPEFELRGNQQEQRFRSVASLTYNNHHYITNDSFFNVMSITGWTITHSNPTVSTPVISPAAEGNQHHCYRMEALIFFSSRTWTLPTAPELLVTGLLTVVTPASA